jgi:hypothetical protein
MVDVHLDSGGIERGDRLYGEMTGLQGQVSLWVSKCLGRTMLVQLKRAYGGAA